MVETFNWTEKLSGEISKNKKKLKNGNNNKEN